MAPAGLSTRPTPHTRSAARSNKLSFGLGDLGLFVGPSAYPARQCEPSTSAEYGCPQKERGSRPKDSQRNACEHQTNKRNQGWLQNFCARRNHEPQGKASTRRQQGHLAATRSSFVRETRWAWVRVYALLWAFTLGSCVLVLVVPGGPALARRVLPLTLTAAHNPPPSLAGVLSIAANNTLRSVWPLTLGLLDAQRRRVTRLLADGVVLGNLVVSGLLVGGAVGGYGVRVLVFLPHLPLEWGGIAVGAAGWVVERKRQLCRHERVIAVTLTVGILASSAIIETDLAPFPRMTVPASQSATHLYHDKA